LFFKNNYHGLLQFLSASNRAAAYNALKNYAAASSDANKCIRLKSDWPKGIFFVIHFHLIKFSGYYRKAQALFGLGCPNMAYKYLTVSLHALGPPQSSNTNLRHELLTEIGCNLRLLNLSPLYKNLPGTSILPLSLSLSLSLPLPCICLELCRLVCEVLYSFMFWGGGV